MNANMRHWIWRRVAAFTVAVGCVAAAFSIGAAEVAPTKLAVFDFTLEDGSAGASIAGHADGDVAAMKAVNAEVRRTLEQSGRYQLVPVGEADARTVRQCDGCEPELAAALGAEQILTGVVRRITRTEYVVSFQLRDAKTGDVLAHRESDLRMGANYSWSRGARGLIKTYLLE